MYRRIVSFAALLNFAGLLHAQAAHDLPACGPPVSATAEWGRTEEGGFAFALPPGARATPRLPSLDHEFGQWTWDDGRTLQFQYGFAVTELAGWLDESFVSGCRASLDGVDAAFLERRQPDGRFVWAIGLFDYVQGYSGGTPGQDSAIPNDLVLIGAGTDHTVFAQGRALFESFRWSRIPASALAAWSVNGAANNGVLVFETTRGATALMLATFRDGEPHWLVGVPPGPVMSYRHGEDDGYVAAPIVLYEASHGVAPGSPDHPAIVTEFADAQFTVSLEDCRSAELAYAPRGGGAPVTLSLRATYPPLHGCTPYRE